MLGTHTQIRRHTDINIFLTESCCPVLLFFILVFGLFCFSILVMTARATLNAPLQLFAPVVEAKCSSGQLLYTAVEPAGGGERAFVVSY